MRQNSRKGMLTAEESEYCRKDFAEFEKLIKEIRRRARKSGLTKRDVEEAIVKARQG